MTRSHVHQLVPYKQPEGATLDPGAVSRFAVEQSRELRIEAAAVRTHVAFAAFALLDIRARTTLTVERSVGLLKRK